jgi:hypothetical protein
MRKKPTYDVISPDGFPTTPKPFKTKAAARAFIPKWCKLYEAQGFYATPRRRIPLDELPYYVQVVKSGEVMDAFDNRVE